MYPGGGRTRARRDPVRLRATSPIGPKLPARSRARSGCGTIASLEAEKSIELDPGRRETFLPSDDPLLFERCLHLGEVGLNPVKPSGDVILQIRPKPSDLPFRLILLIEHMDHLGVGQSTSDELISPFQVTG